MTTTKTKIKNTVPGIFAILSKSKRALEAILVERQKKALPSRIIKHYENDPESQEVVHFLKSNPVEMIPYSFREEYFRMDIKVEKDPVDDLYVVKVNGNDIYFPKEIAPDQIVIAVKTGLMEQDSRSAHRYLPIDSMSIGGDVAVLCGASDGMYTLQIIESFKKIYLFEANPIWIKPLKKTLRNHLHKIELVPLFISDENGPNTTSLDTFFSTRNENLHYIQADIEGHELHMLKGAKQLINSSRDLKLSLCCYHTTKQERELTAFLTEQGYKVSHSNGFLLLWMQYPLLPPYLRRGVLYASR
jgi:hypothetical protein